MAVARIVLGTLVLALIALASLAAAWNARVAVPLLDTTSDVVGDPHLIARAMFRQLASGQESVPPEMAQAVRRAASRDPLTGSGALLAALERREESGPEDAIALLEIARRRDPRNLVTRALLLEAYLLAGRSTDGAREIVALDRLSPAAHSVLLPILWNMIEQPGTQSAAVAALPPSSRLRRSLAHSVAREQLAPELILALQDEPVARGVSQADRQWIASLIVPYVEAGDIAAATLLSQHFYPGSGATSAGITDPEFSGFPGPPFGWALDSAQGGLAELRDNQLWISHNGRSAWTIARQALHLPPGSYRLSYEMAQATSEPPNLVWRVDCQSGTRLLDLPLTPDNIFGMSSTDRFTIPGQDCTVQWLVLAARAGEPASTRRTAFHSVAIVPAGGL